MRLISELSEIPNSDSLASEIDIRQSESVEIGSSARGTTKFRSLRVFVNGKPRDLKKSQHQTAALTSWSLRGYVPAYVLKRADETESYRPAIL